MGLLIDGKWADQWYDTKSTNGKFVRKDASFRNWITSDGSPGPTGNGGFKAESGRYHLYISHACPWAHRTLIFRALKGLEDMIDISVVSPYMHEQGWRFDDTIGVINDDVNHKTLMHEIYTSADENFTGRVTVPVLWDKEKKTIVSNESSEIIRMFNTAFDEIGAVVGDYYPEDLREAIDEVNVRVYSNINNGVYKAGFATTQEAYEDAVGELFAELDRVDAYLADNRYLTGTRITEADWRLFTTLVRFDAVYVGHFKCNIRRIVDYPNIWGYLRELYQWHGVAETVNMHHIKHHYYVSHGTINPTAVVPAGPQIDFNIPHGRNALKGHDG